MSNLRMMDQTKAFPRKVNIDQYKPLIDAALQASVGEDNLSKVAIQDFDTYKLATRAANSIRKHSMDNHLNLRVSCPENGKSVFVYKSNTPARTRKKRSVAAPVQEAVKTPGASL